MILTILIKIMLLANVVAGEDSELLRAMKRHEVIPDLLDEGPEEILKVTFDSKFSANLGEELTPTQVQNPPTLVWRARKDTFYTLLFTEVDAPSREDTSLKEWCHWLIGNIPENDIAKGNIIKEYQGSGPSKNSGLHRYVYLIFMQPENLAFEEEYSSANSTLGRSNFSTKDFAKKYGLGNPVAGNFYQAKYDEFSDVLLARLGINL